MCYYTVLGIAVFILSVFLLKKIVETIMKVNTPLKNPEMCACLPLPTAPASAATASHSFVLLYNVKTVFTVPRHFSIQISSVGMTFLS
jgi:hypothetical protein